MRNRYAKRRLFHTLALISAAFSFFANFLYVGHFINERMDMLDKRISQIEAYHEILNTKVL